MNIDSMKDMMAMVNEMMNFPLKPNATRPTILPPTSITQPATKRPSIPTTQFPFSQTTRNANRFPSKPSTPLPTPAPTNQFTNGITDPNLQTETQTTTEQPNVGLGERTITQEGDFEINSNNNSDRLNTDKETTFSNRPIFISSLGELSTDVGNKFDINKSKIIKPDENEPVAPAPVTESPKTKEQLEKSLADSFRNRQNGNEVADKNAGDDNLLRGLQQVLTQNPDAIMGEADLIEFIQQILKRNPDLTPDQLNVILSTESNAILDIVKDTLERNKDNPKKKTGRNELLDSIQNILNKYKSQSNANNPSTNEQVAVFSGEADLLSQTIRRLAEQSQIPIFSGEADLLQFIERLQQQNPDFTKQQLNDIISGEADSILRFLNERKQQNNGIAISSGEADLLEAIQLVLQKYRNNGSVQPQTPLSQVGSLLANRPSASIESITNKNKPAQTSQRLTPTTETPQFVNQQNGARDSFNANANQNPNDVNTIKPVSAPVLNGQELDVRPTVFSKQDEIESGEADLIQIIKQILLRIPNQRVPIFSGEADLLQFIERLKQQNSDLTTEQLNAIISGEANSILRFLNDKSQQNQAQGFPVLSGEADLLEAFQIVIDKYRQNNQVLPPLPAPVFSGEANLMETIKRILEQMTAPVFSGEADLLQFIRLIQQRNPDLTPAQINSIISDGIDSILRIFNERKQQSAGTQAIFSGEADLLEAIQIVIDQSKANLTASKSSVASGEGDLLSQTLQKISQQSVVPIFSGEADLVQFIERLLQQNPEFSKERLSAILSGEADLISQILNQKAQRSNSGTAAVYSGEADLLEAIQIVLEKYKNTSTLPAPQSSAVPTGEKDLLQTLRQIKQQSAVPLFSAESDIVQFSQRLRQRNPTISPIQLSSIISRETSSILKYLTDKRDEDRFNTFAVYSGEEDLLVAVQYYVEQYARPDTGEIIEPIKSVPVRSGESDLLQALQRIQQRTPVAIFSGLFFMFVRWIALVLFAFNLSSFFSNNFNFDSFPILITLFISFETKQVKRILCNSLN